ncbi:tetratricopeptide repeat protein [Roseobacter sp.]|uniref:tetratricopeptide repeat protein n=1 Tax=Roseobacter sp. TaxID=1907202 RepID=UPI00385AB903
MTLSSDFYEADFDEFIAQVEASGVLGRSKRRIRLLNHLIRSEFLGQGDMLKAYSIGLDIFGKPMDFDPASDSVVRVEMGRLRTALALFEASEFATTRIFVDIPKGTYRPTIMLRRSNIVETVPEPVSTSRTRRRSTLIVGLAALVALFGFGLIFFQDDLRRHSGQSAAAISVAVRSLGSEVDVATQVQSSLSNALSKSKTITILDASGSNAAGQAPRFEVRLSIIEDEKSFLATTELFETANKRLIWSKSLQESSVAGLMAAIENSIARELRVRLFGASKELLEELDPDTLSPEALFVLATWVPGTAQSAVVWEETRVAFARQALEGDPNFGAAHSVLADKLAYLANVHGPADTAENQEGAIYHARRAMDLSPLDPDVVFNVAQSHWHAGRIAESRATMARVIELDPAHDLARFLHLVIPYSCAVAPDDVLKAAIAFDEALSADHPIRWLTLTWIGWLHAYREEWTQALAAEEAAARIFQIPYTFMRRAMILNQLDRTKEAADVIARQDQNWGGFDPAHFATITIPRLCLETEEPDRIIGYYSSLMRALENHSGN